MSTTFPSQLRAMVLRYDAAVTSVLMEWQSVSGDRHETTEQFKQEVIDRIRSFTPK